MKIRQYIYNILIVFLGVSFLSIQFFEQLNIQFTDYLQGTMRLRNEIVIIAIDDESLNEIGAWPWTRDVWAQAFNNLAESKPRVAGIDVLFLEERDGDDAFRHSLSEIKFPVVMASKLTEETVYKSIFSDNIIQSGFVNLSADIDSKIRMTDVYNTADGGCNLSFAFMVFWKYLYPKESFACNEIHDQVTFAEKVYDKRIAFNYTSKAFTQYSFIDLYQGDLDQSLFKDKIVLFGSTAIDLKNNLSDDFTDIWGSKIPGVKIHGNIVNSLLENRFQHNISYSVYLPFTLFVTTFLLWFFRKFKSSLVDFVIFVLIFTGLGILGIFLFDRGINWPFIQVSGALIISYVFMIVYRYLVEQKENRFVKKAFGQYINPVILKKIMNNPSSLKLGGEEKNITILFSDIRGFTTICEGMKPEKVFELTNEYLDLMSGIILKNNGTIDKYVGDEIMAFWNAPLDDPASELNAVNAGIEMLEALEGFNISKPDKLNIRIGIGINTGRSIVGNLGSSNRFDYTVIGDTINTGARLESLTKQYGVPFIISEKVKLAYEEQGGTGLIFRLLDEVVVKGRIRSLRIYQPMAATKENSVLKETYEQAFTLYQNRKFKQSIEFLHKIVSDPPAGVLLTRIDILKNKKDWKGVWVWDEK